MNRDVEHGVRSCVVICLMRNLTFLTILTVLMINAEEMDLTGNRVTSLMLSHNFRPLIFFSNNKLLYLTTKLKAASSGTPLSITNSCSATYNTFFTSLLQSIQGT